MPSDPDDWSDLLSMPGATFTDPPSEPMTPAQTMNVLSWKLSASDHRLFENVVHPTEAGALAFHEIGAAIAFRKVSALWFRRSLR